MKTYTRYTKRKRARYNVVSIRAIKLFFKNTIRPSLKVKYKPKYKIIRGLYFFLLSNVVAGAFIILLLIRGWIHGLQATKDGLRCSVKTYTAPLGLWRVDHTNYTVPSEGKIKVFYNLYTNGTKDEERVQLIIDEQLSDLDPGVHTIEITSIGHRLPSIPDAAIREHHKSGTEALTLHSLWDYCKNHNNADTKVVYLHSKGSYHAHQKNEQLRTFITKGALSKECSNLPDKCNVCSSRMSPLPHPHTSGNMWLARCDYVAKLLDPNALANGKLPKEYRKDEPCTGQGRFFFEHWIHSHPSVMPCDLYPDKKFTWAYDNIPCADFPMDLQMAPRFDISAYNKGNCMFNGIGSGTTVGERRWAYKKLYNITTLDKSWYGWKYLKREDNH